MSKGLTLIETVIGIAIISIGVIFVISSFPLAARIIDLNQKSNTALFLASSQIEKMIYQDYKNIEQGFFVEDFGEIIGFEDYKRETEISCFLIDEECQSDEILKVEVIVYPKSFFNKEVALTTVITKK